MKGPVEPPPARAWSALLRLALDEDIGPGDVTTAVATPEDHTGAAVVEARQTLVVCGLGIAGAVFREVDPRLAFEPFRRDGEIAAAGEPLAHLSGSVRSILTAERTALNFLMRLCGVATHTRRFVEAVAGTGVEIVDTRKTLPGWRVLDKYACAVGGARNHRLGLYDGVLLKDNHIAAAGGVAAAVKNALAATPANLRVQVEVESEDDAVAAVEAGADFLLLDNQRPAQMRSIAERLAGRALLEVSGGVGLENVREIAGTGIQRISIGALTHSAPAADVALEMAAPGGVGE
jgi:nicotinate-nucleotide pyrophosphorylase (carboxylating)